MKEIKLPLLPDTDIPNVLRELLAALDDRSVEWQEIHITRERFTTQIQIKYEDTTTL